MQGWCVARTTHCDSGYEVTIATYSLPDLYLPKMKNALFNAPEFNTVSSACNVHICSHPLNEQQDQITLLDREKLWFSSLNRESLEPIVLPWKCHSRHIMELCDECKNCTKFQLYTEKVVRDIKFFVILHHFVSTKSCHQSSNLHKSKSWITRQSRVLSQ